MERLVQVNIESILEKIDLSDYDFDLPPARIAQKPLANREQSKLLIADCNSQNIKHHHFFEIADFLPKPALLFVNETKVISARLHFYKESGRRIEIFCLEPKMDSLAISLHSSANKEDKHYAFDFIEESQCPVQWNCLIGGRRVRAGDEFEASFNLTGKERTLHAKIIEKESAEAVVEFNWEDKSLNFSEILTAFGKIPLPPYIKRPAEEEDALRYQTVYARKFGSVASATAGLHFTESVLNNIKEKGIKIAKLELNIGLGTFRPIQAESVFEHRMHQEHFSISVQAIEELLHSISKEEKIIATGTTSLRVLESLPIIAAKIKLGSNFVINQWDSYIYESKKLIPETKNSLEIILKFLKENNLTRLSADTSLFVVPGFAFRVVDLLLTNYHLPKTSLVLLVAAFLGKEFWRKVYREALEKNYRFLSYGDSSLLMRSF
ncbi:MAG: S-adenosylmethionine:tRNA ribosyltransferase-isomerase [Ignavibacteria bacterium]|nr:S-adenosylmethionine:tRNA ribosyltransferase-isomerase [Ignavibacteria bacterium]